MNDKITTLYPLKKFENSSQHNDNLEYLRKTRNSSKQFMTRYQNEITIEKQKLWYDNLPSNITPYIFMVCEMGVIFYPCGYGIILIENEELKSLLLEIYNHQSNRNYATSYQIDLLAIKFSETIHKNFRINSEYNYKEGQIYGRPVVKNFIFDEKFYYSNEFYGLLSEGKQNGNDYLRLLDDISENYKQAKIYAQYEIED